VGVHPVQLLGHQEERRHRRGVDGLVQPGLLDRLGEPEEGRDVAAAPVDLLGPGDRGGRQQRDPQAAVGGEGLLRREEVDVGLAGVERQPARRRGRVDDHQRVAGDPLDRRHHAGGGLVVGDRIDVDPVLGLRQHPAAGLGPQHRRRAQPRGALGGLRELRAERAEHGVLAALADQRVGDQVEERDRPAVAEDDLVARRQREELGQPPTYAPDELLDRRLAVRRAHQRRPRRRQRLEPPVRDLRRTGAESAVPRQQVGRNP